MAIKYQNKQDKKSLAIIGGLAGTSLMLTFPVTTTVVATAVIGGTVYGAYKLAQAIIGD